MKKKTVKTQTTKVKTTRKGLVEKRVSAPTQNLILIEYNSNNSGGSWWLKDEDWKNLAKAGWKIVWAWEEYVYNKKGDYEYDENGYPKTKGTRTKGERWLGALAKYAWKKFATVTEAIKEFEKVTGQEASAEGCNCCGAPHSFSWDGGYCSGENCLEYLYQKPPTTLREACELLERAH